MFTGLWKQASSAKADDALTQHIERSDGTVLTFNGELGLQLSGSDSPDHLPGEPHHQISVYRPESGTYAVVIEFYVPGQPKLVDAELISSVDEMDDFFCIHVSDLFQNRESAFGEAPPKSADEEQLVLRRYDALVSQVLKSLKTSTNAESPPVGDLRVQSAASGVDCSASLVNNVDGDGGSADE